MTWISTTNSQLKTKYCWWRFDKLFKVPSSISKLFARWITSKTIWWKGFIISERYRRRRSTSSKCFLNVRLKRSSFRSWSWRIPSWAHIVMKIGIRLLKSMPSIEKNMNNSCMKWTQETRKEMGFIYKIMKIRVHTEGNWTKKALESHQQLDSILKNRRF